jgi:phosphoribosylglycinamide formyltransferase-1
VKNIAIFASGAGSNARKIIEYFNRPGNTIARVVMVLCNKPGAGVLAIAEENGIPAIIINRDEFFRGSAYLPELKEHHADLLVLAGFLWKVPETLIKAYPRAIVNIHPALLPSFGGKGMYGRHVHEAVLNAGCTESGITIHYVDGHYDNGDIIFQAKCEVAENDTPESLAMRIHALEHRYYPEVIEKIASLPG